MARARRDGKLPEVGSGFPVEHRQVSVNGIDLHLAEAGEGPPVLLLHGWPQHWWCWRELIPQLAAEHRVLAPDLRGWGWSDAPPGSYSKSTFAADMLALLDHEGIDRVRIIGHDWGGFTAFLLALEHPERVERMLALDIVPPWTGPLRPRQVALPFLLSYQMLLATPVIGPATMTQSNAFIRTVIRAASHRRNWTRSELDVYAEVLRDPARARASSACYRTFLLREAGGRLGRYRPNDLHVPTLLVMGSRSAINLVLNPQPSENLSVRQVPDAGHFLPEEAPTEILDLARSFFGHSAMTPSG